MERRGRKDPLFIITGNLGRDLAMARQNDRLLEDFTGVDIHRLLDRHDPDHDAQSLTIAIGASSGFLGGFKLHGLTGAKPAPLLFELLYDEELARRHDPPMLRN